MATLLLPGTCRIVNINQAAKPTKLAMLLSPPQLCIQPEGLESLPGVNDFLKSDPRKREKRKKEIMEREEKSQGSLFKRMYETFLFNESVLKTGLSGILQPHPQF